MWWQYSGAQGFVCSLKVQFLFKSVLCCKISVLLEDFMCIPTDAWWLLSRYIPPLKCHYPGVYFCPLSYAAATYQPVRLISHDLDFTCSKQNHSRLKSQPLPHSVTLHVCVCVCVCVSRSSRPVDSALANFIITFTVTKISISLHLQLMPLLFSVAVRFRAALM
jgi:hypothetical protein